jgi:CBS domain containing-hemolysin-like protein
LVKSKKKGAATLNKIKEQPRKLIITILIGNNLANIAASTLAAKIMIDMFGSTGIGIATGIMTFLILVFGEIIPKTFALAHAEEVSLAVAPVMEFLMYVLYPLVAFFEAISKAGVKLSGADKEPPLLTEEEFETLLEIGAKENVLERKEKELIEGILEFNDITVEEVMTPRVKMFCLDADMTVKEALPLINRENFSRIPVYDETIDKIVGVVMVRDVLDACIKRKTGHKLRKLAIKPLFTSSKRIISPLFKELQENRKHMAIVVDEFGGTEGVVTMEDLLEEIVGEIMDESDISPKMIMRIDKDNIIVHGDTEINDINDFFNIALPRPERNITISGLLHHKLKKIPKKGNKLRLSIAELTVEEVSQNKILKVRIKKLRKTQ